MLRPTTVIGILGAFGNMNLTSWNLFLLLQFSAKDTHPAPESPSPWAMIMVAVCFVTAGIVNAVGGGILVVVSYCLLADIICDDGMFLCCMRLRVCTAEVTQAGLKAGVMHSIQVLSST